MARKRKTKDDAPESLAEALDALDAVHGAIVKMALHADITPAAQDALTSPDNDDLPLSSFDVGEMDTGPERGGGVVLDTRIELRLDDEQAEAMIFALARSVREGGDLIALELDGRLVIGAAAAKDFRRALREGA
jgi:hypothetical protein